MIIKKFVDDFKVYELPSREWSDSGKYFVYKLIKKNLTTTSAVKLLAKYNKLRLKDIKYAGLKDKRGVTEQFISVPKKIFIDHKQIQLIHVGFSDEHLYLGDLKGNKFEIIVRDVSELRDVQIPNYYGDQRFSRNNIDIGLCLLKKEFHKAFELISLQHKIKKTSSDIIRSLKSVPFRLLLLYVHSVQSYLFNRVVSDYLSSEKGVFVNSSSGPLFFPFTLEDKQVPLVGVAQDLGSWSEFYNPLMESLNIKPCDFLIRQIPGLTLEGGERNIKSNIISKDIRLFNDEAKVSLVLGPGCYATVCLKGWFT